MSEQHRAARAASNRLTPSAVPRLARSLVWALAIALGFSSATRADEAPVTRSAALVLARANSPALDAAHRRVGEARGELTGASVLLPENPEVELGAGPRFLDPGVSGSRLGLEAGVSQRFEIGGQRGHRIDRARANVASAEADADRAARALDLAVMTGFIQALGAGERARIAAEHEALARELLDIDRARFERGAATPVEVNGARIRLAEATRRRARSEAEARAATARLAPLLGIDPARPLVLAGDIPAPSPSPPVLASEVIGRRPEVLAAAARTQSAQAAAQLAGSAAWPDVRVGARYATEEGSRAVLGQLAFGLPIFQRNQGERERAEAAAARAKAEERAIRAQASTEVEEARIEAEGALKALAVFDGDVLRALEESLMLLRRMLDAGKVAPVEVILLQRELLEGRLGYVDARIDAAIADARLRTVTGSSITQDANGGGR